MNPSHSSDATPTVYESKNKVKHVEKRKVEKEEKEVCPICADTYTAVLRRKIVCKFCFKDACTKCIEQYLLGRIEDAHCIHCRVNYSDSVLKEICTKTYLQQTYFRHRQEILMNRERASLPALQDMAKRERTNREYIQRIRKAREDLNALRHDKARLILQSSALTSLIRSKIQLGETAEKEQKEMQEIFELEDQCRSSIREKKREISLLTNEQWRSQRANAANQAVTEEEDEKEERKKFIRRCMKPGCQGFLSTAWKCGICEHYSCSKCFTVKGPDHDTPHTCKKEDLDTAELIRADSKPCPKCGEFINKSSGCFGHDTPILCWNGEIKMSQDITKGDVLVGDNGLPRQVLDTMYGVEELYEISQENGITYVVNGAHTLLVKRRDTLTDVIEITVIDYIGLSTEQQSILVGYKLDQTITLSSLSIKSIGLGRFYGWQVDDNHRFILSDGTIVRNCDQMYCITCHTPWSWTTGKIVTHGVIHNPHYYEWLRRTGGSLPRNPADIPCGGYPGGWELRNISRNTTRRRAQYLYEFHRICMELQEISERNYRSHIDQQNLSGTHVRFLLGDFAEKEWGKRLAVAEKRRKRDAEIQEVFAAFRMVAVELINRIQHYRDESVDSFTLLPLYRADQYLEQWNGEVQSLVHMVNEGLKKISESHYYQVPIIEVSNLNDPSKHIHYRIGQFKWKNESRTRKEEEEDQEDQEENQEKEEDQKEQDDDEDEDNESPLSYLKREEHDIMLAIQQSLNDLRNIATVKHNRT